MAKKTVHTDIAPAAIGPYSQAVMAGGFVFVSGQIPLDPASGELITGDILEQTRRVLNNIAEILTAAGSSLDEVVKATVYMSNMNNYAAINEVYGEFFGESKPARAAVEVARLPKDVGVEIDVIALA